ncbi:isoaspartyl peptidase/L-asparaginase family protein [Balneola sp. MJW-20]|uniref:isoaspartyl peptidase/L-asparaginase family protein n=1 Tax=Gracilimonas aurantiaca TaxID=3234185 RepID=UPI00346685E1
MINRKDFIRSGLFGLIPLSVRNLIPQPKASGPFPVVISTWNTGIRANAAAWEVLSKGGYALDAVETGVKVEEADPKNMSVGYGGRPDREGKVTLDACVMDERGECGSVAFLQDIKHPVSVARKVMTESPHWMLVGEGARQFALDQGFKAENLLTPEAEKAWKNWLKNSEYKPVINIENHDTIGMLAIDEQGRLCGACTTSGAAWKMHGRVGDSPIIGAGLFVDPNVGGATATGLGEEVVKTAGAALIVEFMRQGHDPSVACKMAVERIIERDAANKEGVQVGYIALNKDGAFGGYSILNGFTYAVYNEDGNRVIKSEHLI